jgi:hypothetical protein
MPHHEMIHPFEAATHNSESDTLDLAQYSFTPGAQGGMTIFKRTALMLEIMVLTGLSSNW